MSMLSIGTGADGEDYAGPAGRIRRRGYDVVRSDDTLGDVEAMAIEKRRTKAGKVRWVYRWKEGSRYRAKVFDRRRDAEIFEGEIRRRRQMGSLQLEGGGRKTVEDLHAAWWEMHYPASRRPRGGPTRGVGIPDRAAAWGAPIDRERFSGVPG